MKKELLHKYFKGETSIEEEKLIMDWAESSPENYRDFLEERKRWNALLLHYTLNTNKKTMHVNFRRFIQYAALFAVLFTVGFYFLYTDRMSSSINIKEIQVPTLILENKEQIALNKNSFAIQKGDAHIKNDNKNNKLSYQQQSNKITKKTNHLLVPHGQTYQLELSDGTLVTLNAESELIFPSQFDSNQRNVTLIGEAYFQVTRDEKRPFIVQTEQLNVHVLGTTFNVSCYQGDPVVKTTLVEGSVKVEQQGEDRIIHPSEQYQYNKETKEKSVETVDTYLFTSWIHNEYIFKNTSLEEIFAQIGHWYSFTPSYEQEDLKNTHFTFKVSRDVTLDQIIKLINNTDEVCIEKINHHIYIKNRKK